LPLEFYQAALNGGTRTKLPTMVAGPSPEEHLKEHDFDPARLSLRVRATLAAQRSSVDAVVQQVMDIVRQMKCANGKEDAIELSLLEALANAVVHGAKEDPNKIVECLVACDEQRGMLILCAIQAKDSIPRRFPVARWARIFTRTTAVAYFSSTN
jgi:hypothetical protein